MFRFAIPAAAAALAVAAAIHFSPPRAAGGSQPVEDVPAAALLGAVAAWTAEASGLPLSLHLPVIVRASRDEMAAIHYGGAATDAARGAVTVEALYDEAGGRILLADDWTGASPEDLSILVHEMVHHLQAASGARHACPAEREALAYDVQDRWLQAFGSDLETAFAITPLTRFVFTSCGM